MSNEIANRSHAGLVLQVFAALPAVPPIAVAAWGVDVATLQKLFVGFYVVRLTQSLSLTVNLDDPRAGRFDCIVTAQGLALPNFVTGFIQPDPFTGGAAPGPGGEIQFPWLGVQTLDQAGTNVDVDAVLNVEVRRIPRRGL